MLAGYSEKAIMTKVKAMYGRRITERQYEELTHKKSVAEIAAYLRDTAGYRDQLSGIQPNAIHRGQLEMLLRKERFSRYTKLLRYNASPKNDSFYSYPVREVEVDQILQLVQLLNSGTASEYIYQYPAFLDRYTAFDMMKLASVRSFDDLLKALSGTSYEAVLRGCQPASGEMIDYTACEAALKSDFYDGIKKEIERKYRRKTKRQLLEIFDTLVELLNVGTIYRLKRYFPDMLPDEIRKCLLPVWDRIPEKQLSEMLLARSPEQFISMIETSAFRKYIGTDDFTFIEYSVGRITYRVSRRYLRFATSAPTAFSAYLSLCDIELRNLTTIIEGVRYSLPPGELMKMLIL